MKKRITSLRLLVSFMTCGIFCLSACNNSKHVHSYVDFVIEETCTTDGYTVHKCSCGYETKDTIVPSLGTITEPIFQIKTQLAPMTGQRLPNAQDAMQPTQSLMRAANLPILMLTR